MCLVRYTLKRLQQHGIGVTPSATAETLWCLFIPDSSQEGVHSQPENVACSQFLLHRHSRCCYVHINCAMNNASTEGCNTITPMQFTMQLLLCLQRTLFLHAGAITTVSLFACTGCSCLHVLANMHMFLIICSIGQTQCNLIILMGHARCRWSSMKHLH